MENQTITTLTGRPVTVPAGCRLTFSDYTKAQARARQEGVSLAQFIAQAVLAALGSTEAQQQPQGANK